jgi:hypothetical protein
LAIPSKVSRRESEHQSTIVNQCRFRSDLHVGNGSRKVCKARK